MGLKEQIELNNNQDKLTTINWNEESDGMSEIYWNQGVNQIWFPEEFDISRDLASWSSLTDDEKETYKKVLSGLTGLDAKQGGEGMNLISLQEPRNHYKAVFGYMGMMEFVHEKSYSHIFTTILSNKESNYLLNDWVENEPHLEIKAKYIGFFYKQLLKPHVTNLERYMAKVASCFLESALFYSGFYYPLLLSGQGRMTQSGSIIYKITQDESYHGSAVGLTAQYDYELLSEEQKRVADEMTYELLEILYENEISYTKSLYDKLGLTEDVIRYVEYNFNRALANLGKDDYFHPEPFNAIVENQTNVDKISNDDFFSRKPDYEKSTNIKDIKDEDFSMLDDGISNTVDEFL